jgi:hypothetical protein
MFILKNPPNIFLDGDIFSPDQINDNNSYFASAFDFVRNRQNARWTSTYSLVPSAGSTLNSSSSLSTLSRYSPALPTALEPVIVESVDIVAYYTTPVSFTLYVNGGTEAETERIVFPARAADKATEPYFVTRLMGSALKSRLLTLTSSNVPNNGSFTSLPLNTSITKMDVTVGFIHNKYNGFAAAGTAPSLTLPEFTDVSAAVPSEFTALKSTVEAAATAAQRGQPLRWIAADFGAINSTTPIGLRSITLPEFAFANPTITAAAAIRGVSLQGILSSAPVGGIITAGLGLPAFYDLTVNITSGFPTNFVQSNVPTPSAPATDYLNVPRQLTVSVSPGVALERCTAYLLLG